MASGFVSAGAINPVTGEAAALETSPPSSATAAAATITANTIPVAAHGDTKTEEWLAVKKELEADRRRREEQLAAAGAPGAERSLYEVLQANKAAKQAAFEEANRIKNQFRALDDEEVDFLDGVRARQRAEEESVRRETEERLRAFREAQRGGAGTGAAGGEEDGEGVWEQAGRKRKRERGPLKGVAKRRVSGGGKADVGGERAEAAADGAVQVSSTKDDIEERGRKSPEVALPALVTSVAPRLGLVDYGSDDDDDND